MMLKYGRFSRVHGTTKHGDVGVVSVERHNVFDVVSRSIYTQNITDKRV